MAHRTSRAKYQLHKHTVNGTLHSFHGYKAGEIKISILNDTNDTKFLTMHQILVRKGLLQTHVSPHGAQYTAYSLTDQGFEAVQNWAGKQSRF